MLMPSGCRRGICHGCVVPLLSGAVRDLRTGVVHGEPGDLVQTCVSAPSETSSSTCDRPTYLTGRSP